MDGRSRSCARMTVQIRRPNAIVSAQWRASDTNERRCCVPRRLLHAQNPISGQKVKFNSIPFCRNEEGEKGSSFRDTLHAEERVDFKHVFKPQPSRCRNRLPCRWRRPMGAPFPIPQPQMRWPSLPPSTCRRTQWPRPPTQTCLPGLNYLSAAPDRLRPRPH